MKKKSRSKLFSTDFSHFDKFLEVQQRIIAHASVSSLSQAVDERWKWNDERREKLMKNEIAPEKKKSHLI